jgi:TDG/mug DNA glycosylase family protein
MPGLRDVVVDRPRLLLVGINPGLRSGALGHHFAGRGNPFWRLLAAARVTPVQLDYADDRRLAEFGIALTNLCPRTTRTAAELTRAEIARGRVALARKIARWKPAVVTFVGVSLYAMYFSRSAPQARRATVVFSGSRTPALRAGAAGGRGTRGGPGAKPETISGARVFVVPNPSGLNASYPGFAHKLVWFKQLRRFMNRV